MKMNLPVEGLPRPVADIITEVSAVYGCPRDFVTATVLSTASTATGKKLTVTDGKYTNLPVLWLVLVARSGSNKTYPMKVITEPLRIIDYELNTEYMEEYEAWKKLPAKERPRQPQFGALVVDDCSEARRNEILYMNNTPGGSDDAGLRGLTGIYPEIKGMLDAVCGEEGGSAAVSRLLRLYDGDDIKVDRKNDPTMLIRRPFFNILGDLQPGLLKATFGNDLFTSNGLNQRFLFCLADNLEYARRGAGKVDTRLRNGWTDIVKSLYSGCVFGPERQTEARLAGAAEKIYDDFYNSLQQKKRLCANDYFASIYSKLQIQAQRMAGVIHALNLACGCCQSRRLISEDEMHFAVETMRYFELTALRVYFILNPEEAGSRPAIRAFAALYPNLTHGDTAAVIGCPERTVTLSMRPFK